MLGCIPVDPWKGREGVGMPVEGIEDRALRHGDAADDGYCGSAFADEPWDRYAR